MSVETDEKLYGATLSQAVKTALNRRNKEKLCYSKNQTPGKARKKSMLADPQDLVPWMAAFVEFALFKYMIRNR